MSRSVYYHLLVGRDKADIGPGHIHPLPEPQSVYYLDLGESTWWLIEVQKTGDMAVGQVSFHSDKTGQAR